MGPTQSNSREMKVEADRQGSTTSAWLRERARQYRLAAALADCPRDEAMFCDLAMMFDQLGARFRAIWERAALEDDQARANQSPRT